MYQRSVSNKRSDNHIVEVGSPVSPKPADAQHQHQKEQQQTPRHTQRRRVKRGPRIQSSQRWFLERLLALSMLSMGLVLLWRIGYRSSDGNSTGAGFDTSFKQQQQQLIQDELFPKSPKFELYSTDAPSCSSLPVDDISFTLVTQLSHDRLWMMEHHCERYPHPMSIAVFSNSTQSDIIDELTKLKCDMEIVSVQTLDAHSYPFDDYPVNTLRNLALSSVKTTHIIYIDVDFWPSEGLYQVLMQKSIREELVADYKLALVIPAFQLFRQCREWVDCRQKNLPHMPYTLSELVSMIHNEQGFVFDPTNKGGHGSTLYAKWTKQPPASLLEIPCLKSNRYEPFVAVRYCRDLPPFQRAFTGYGKNKMTWMMQMIRSGYRLSQVGGAYLCHYPHLDSSSRQNWNQAPKKLQVDSTHVRKPRKEDGDLHLQNYKRGQIDQLFVEFRDWLAIKIPDQTILHQCDGAQDDDSKLWVDREAGAVDNNH